MTRIEEKDLVQLTWQRTKRLFLLLKEAKLLLLNTEFGSHGNHKFGFLQLKCI